MATYRDIQNDIRARHRRVVKTCWIAHVKELNGLALRSAPNRHSPSERKYPCSPSMRIVIEESMHRLGVLQTENYKEFTMLNLIRLTPELSFANILDGGRDSYPAAYQNIVDTWLFKPINVLLEEYPPDNKFRGLSAFALALMFFEQHGEFLTGETTRGRSKFRFCLAFDRYLLSCGGANSNTHPDSKAIYKWARCGLFHSARMSHDLLIDAMGYSETPFCKNPFIKDGWLVNPAALVVSLEKYLSEYVDEVNSSSEDSEVSKNFHATFERIITEPLQHFSNASGF